MARRKPRPPKNEMYKKPPFRAEKNGDKPDRVSWDDVMAKMKQIQEEHQIPIFAASLKGAATLWSGACVDDFNAGAYLNDDIRNLRDWRDVEKAGGAIIMNNAPYNGGGAAYNVDFPMLRDEFGEYFEGSIEIQFIESDTLPLDKIRQYTQELVDYINENGVQQYEMTDGRMARSGSIFVRTTLPLSHTKTRQAMKSPLKRGDTASNQNTSD